MMDKNPKRSEIQGKKIGIFVLPIVPNCATPAPRPTNMNVLAKIRKCRLHFSPMLEWNKLNISPEKRYMWNGINTSLNLSIKFTRQ